MEGRVLVDWRLIGVGDDGPDCFPAAEGTRDRGAGDRVNCEQRVTTRRSPFPDPTLPNPCGVVSRAVIRLAAPAELAVQRRVVAAGREFRRLERDGGAADMDAVG